MTTSTPTPDVPIDRLFAIAWHARQARRSRAGVAAVMRRWLSVSADFGKAA